MYILAYVDFHYIFHDVFPCFTFETTEVRSRARIESLRAQSAAEDGFLWNKKSIFATHILQQSPVWYHWIWHLQRLIVYFLPNIVPHVQIPLDGLLNNWRRNNFTFSTSVFAMLAFIRAPALTISAFSIGTSRMEWHLLKYWMVAPDCCRCSWVQNMMSRWYKDMWELLLNSPNARGECIPMYALLVTSNFFWNQLSCPPD